MENTRLKLAKEKFEEKNQVDENLKFEDFILECYIKCSPQSYGPKIEKKIIKQFQFEKIKKKLGQGDLEVTQKTEFTPFNNFSIGKKMELKVSFLTSGDSSYNLIQLRPYEVFDFYLFLLIDCENDFELQWFLLNKSDVSEKNFKINAIHGNKESVAQNVNVEYKLNVKKNSEHYNKLVELNLIK